MEYDNCQYNVVFHCLISSYYFISHISLTSINLNYSIKNECRLNSSEWIKRIVYNILSPRYNYDHIKDSEQLSCWKIAGKREYTKVNEAHLMWYVKKMLYYKTQPN